MKFFFSLLILAVFIPSYVSAEEIQAGFVEGLWYSESLIFVDEPVRIYAALRNNTGSDLTGTVEFKDGDKLLERKQISALSGRLIEVWTDTAFSYGDHIVSARLTGVRLHTVGESSRPAEVSNALSESLVFIDHDTDGDRIGNEEDADDDNDGISDKEEVAAGTNPLSPETSTENDTESKTAEGSADQESDSETPQQPKEKSPASEEVEGFEKYFDDGAIDSVLRTVTEKVVDSKESLDSYREERSAKREAERSEKGVSSEETVGENGEPLATITRSKIDENPGIFAIFISGLLGILSGLYTLLLWVVSGLLAYPGLIQFLFLIAILIGAYKLARRLGRRPE